jgi:hypothetical protein
MTLNETLRTYHKSLHAISQLGENKVLLASIHLEVQQLLANGLKLKWDHFMASYEPTADSRHVMFVGELAAKVNILQDKATVCSERIEQIDAHISSLSSLEYDRSAFAHVIKLIQKMVDLFHFDSFSNLDHWIVLLDKRIANELRSRLTMAIKVLIFNK